MIDYYIFQRKGRDWYRLNTLEEVMRLKKNLVKKSGRDNVKLVCGNTASGIYPDEKPLHLIDISRIQALSVLYAK